MSSVVSAPSQVPALKNFVVIADDTKLLTSAGVVSATTYDVGTILKDMGSQIYRDLPSPLGGGLTTGIVLRKVAVATSFASGPVVTGYVQISGNNAAITDHTGRIVRLN